MIAHSQGFTQMLVSMCAYPEFYKKYMKLLVGVGPACQVNHHRIKLLNHLANSDSIIAGFKAVCPDVLF